MAIAKNAELPKILTLRQVADLLNVHPETVRRWDKTKKLISIRVGNRGHRRYQQKELLNILNNHQKRQGKKTF